VSNHADQDQGVDAEDDSIDIAIVKFLGSSRVISMWTLKKTFLVDENLIPINIEKIPVIYKMF